MSCCSPNSSCHIAENPCPECSTASKSVAVRTLYHQVRFPENLTIAPDQYYFCRDKNCSVAYFTLAGLTISKQHLRAIADIRNNKLCYCFDIDVAQYTAALETNSAEPMKKFVIQKTRSGDCACEARNPSGRCCLADFKQMEKQFLTGC